jgi:dipeptidyl aminopeptidase/acylaminoacyl peptidase
MTAHPGITNAMLALCVLGGLACSSDGSGPGTCEVSVSFTPAEPRLATGDSLQLAAALSSPPGCPSWSGNLSWASSDPGIVAVDAATGLATAKSAGTVDIEVRKAGAASTLSSIEVTAFAPLFDRIIFTRQAPCQATCPVLELWTMNPAGGGLRLAVDSLHYPEHPRVSPDGKSIVVEDWGQLILTDAGGGGRRVLDTGVADAFGPWWSPDGQWIVYTGGGSLNPPFQVHLMRADGTGQRQLTDDPLGSYDPAWSPDGRIVYIRHYAIGLGPVQREAVVMDTTGTVLQVLTTGLAGFNGHQPAWSPDGQTILFLGTTDRDWIITKLTLATMRYDTLGSALGNRPGDWSPDGQRIVFGTGDLWTMSPDGSSTQLLLGDGYNNFEAAWTPAAGP